MSNEKDIDEILKKSFGVTPQNGTTVTLPGMRTRILPASYTSEAEIRAKVLEVVKMPRRKFSAEELDKSFGDDQLLRSKYEKIAKKEVTIEEKMQMAEAWIAKLVKDAKRRNRLMTDIQLEDWKMNRRFAAGTRARYIGPEREEKTEAFLRITRPHGQTGFITNVLDSKKEGRLITFHPDEAVYPNEAPGVDKQFVDLQVREYTAGWLTLERLP